MVLKINYITNKLYKYLNKNSNTIKFLTIILLIFLIPRIISLGFDMANVDSQYWYPRIHNFPHKFLTQQYQDTYQKYHPGVTLMILSGFATTLFETVFEFVFGYSPRYIPTIFPYLHFTAKFPLVFVISVLATYSTYLIRRISNNKTLAYIFAVLLSLEPYFLGVSRYLHLTALATMFAFTSVIALVYYILNYRKAKYSLIISAILLGLGILTKIDVLITGAFNALLFAGGLFLTLKNTQSIKNILVHIFKYGLLYFAIVIITFYLFFPSMWVAPYWTIKEIITDGIKDTAFVNKGAESITNIKEFYYFEVILLRASPILIIFGITGLVFTIKEAFKSFKGKTSLNNEYVLSILMIFYIILVTIILTIPSKTKDRYVISLFPSLILISSIGVYYLYRINKYIKYSLIIILICFYSITIFRYHPYYSYYYDDLIGGPAGIKNLGLTVINRGEYYAKVADYINKTDEFPEISNTILAGRFKFDTFRPYYLGTPYANPKLMPNDITADYILVETSHKHVKIPKDKCKLVKTFGTKPPFEFDALYLYKCQNLDNSYKDFNN